MRSMKKRFLESQGYDDWSVSPTGVLRCPHGHLVEDDGSCPEGCESPMLDAGII